MRIFLLLIFFITSDLLALEIKRRITILSPQREKFTEVSKNIKDELGSNYLLTQVNLSSDYQADVKAIENSKPNLIVMMENKSIKVIREYQKNQSNQSTPIVSTMVLQVESQTENILNISGVKIEIPAYTIFTDLKIISQNPIKRIGVFHTKDFEDFIQRSKKMVAKERMKLISYCVDCYEEGSPNKIAKFMKKNFKKRLLKKDKIDVMWMLPDNRILNTKTLKKFWIKDVKKSKIPLVVPIENLAAPDSDLGLIVFYPDYSELGSQVASQITDILEEGTHIKDVGFEELISVVPIVNKKRALRINWALKEKEISRLKHTEE